MMHSGYHIGGADASIIRFTAAINIKSNDAVCLRAKLSANSSINRRVRLNVCGCQTAHKRRPGYLWRAAARVTLYFGWMMRIVINHGDTGHLPYQLKATTNATKTRQSAANLGKVYAQIATHGNGRQGVAHVVAPGIRRRASPIECPPISTTKSVPPIWFGPESRAQNIDFAAPIQPNP
jgi:hypothetical protein